VLPTFTLAQVKRLATWRPRARDRQGRRLKLLVLLLLDTGCRITEVLMLRVADVDVENLPITLDGKGRKQRVVRFPFELKRFLYRYVSTAHWR
jgi:integrase/recombinase XerD